MSVDIKIRKSFGSFELESEFYSEGGIMGLLGASGCGKTLTLQSIAGVIRPDEGHIIVNDRVLFDSEKKIDLHPRDRRVGYLFQNYALFPNMTVEQNINCGLLGESKREKRKISPEERAGRIKNVIEKMGLEGLEKRKPDQLSGGQQQRAALGRMLIGKPDIILMDEPMSALDSHLKLRLRFELLETLNDYGIDTIIVTHDRDEAYEMCNNIAVMDKGKIVEKGETKQLFTKPLTKTGAVLTGCKNVVRAEKDSPQGIFVPEWGVHFDTGRDVADETAYVGIRAHYFGPDIAENSNRIRITDILEQPFEWVVKFRYENQADSSEPVWWRLPKTEKFDESVDRIGVMGKDVLDLIE